MLRTPDRHRAVRLERRTHAVRADRALGPAEPGRQIGVAGSGERGLVTPLGQDPAGGIGDGDDATEVAHFVCQGGSAKPQLSEYDIALRRMVELRDGHRSLCAVRIDPVLLSAAMPGDRHQGPDIRDLVLALHEPLPRREHGAAVQVRRAALKPMYIAHGSEPPWSIPGTRRACAPCAPVAARRGRVCGGPGPASRVFLLRHSFQAVSPHSPP